MIRRTVFEDLPQVMHIYECARELMRKSGNPNQWGTDKPELELIEKDICEGNSYVITDGDTVHAVFAYIPGEDVTYGYIEDGQWLNDEPYGTIHRIASDGKIRGVLKQAVDFAGEHLPNVRVDTHHDNQIMQHQLLKLGFTYCGTIYLLNGDPRRAYHKIVEKAAHV